MSMPKDPVMLLSFINTQLRDNFSSLDELAAAYMVDKESLMQSLANIDYHYNEEQNRFV